MVTHQYNQNWVFTGIHYRTPTYFSLTQKLTKIEHCKHFYFQNDLVLNRVQCGITSVEVSTWRKTFKTDAIRTTTISKSSENNDAFCCSTILILHCKAKVNVSNMSDLVLNFGMSFTDNHPIFQVGLQHVLNSTKKP